jgi:hypothetical protein
VRYVVLPQAEVDTTLLEDATRRGALDPFSSCSPLALSGSWCWGSVRNLFLVVFSLILCSFSTVLDSCSTKNDRIVV